jgi:hypothetical protein
MFRTTIDLKGKPDGYLEALEAYVKKYKAIGMQTEAGVPNLTPYKDAKRRLWRLGQINPTSVCSVLKEPTHNVTDGTYTFVAHYHGPLRDALKHARESGGVTLGARMVQDAQGRVIEILQLDFIPNEHHTDYTHEVSGKPKKKK